MPPILTGLDLEVANGARLLTAGKKRGLLSPDNKIVLEAKYDDLWIDGERAWVRLGDKVGLCAVDGRWILRPSLQWPAGADLPSSFNDKVAWFRHGKRWGLLSEEGKVLFAPRFEAHVMGSRELEEWEHPEGLDFKNERAWVREGGRWLLIDNTGRVLGKFNFREVARWSDDLYRFSDASERWGLISRDGSITLTAQFSEIRELQDGMAVVVERHDRKNAAGEKDTFWTYGFVNARGELVIPCGKYGQDSGPYSEGLARAWRNAGGDTYDPKAGYVDRDGKEVIAFDYRRTESFPKVSVRCRSAGRGRPQVPSLTSTMALSIGPAPW